MKIYFETLAKALLKEPFHTLAPQEQEVIESIAKREPITQNANEKYAKAQTLGERVADKIATFGGSWPFIFIFFSVIASWIAINSAVLMTEKNIFDPYPFILLNLGLSTLAAFQAPIIMMSQNRQAEKDRIVQQTAYEISLKLELQVARLHQKLNDIMEAQNIAHSLPRPEEQEEQKS